MIFEIILIDLWYKKHKFLLIIKERERYVCFNNNIFIFKIFINGYIEILWKESYLFSNWFCDLVYHSY